MKRSDVYVGFFLTRKQAEELSLQAVGKALAGERADCAAWGALAQALADGKQEADAKDADRAKREVTCHWCGRKVVQHKKTRTARPHDCTHGRSCARGQCGQCDEDRRREQEAGGRGTPP